MSKTITIKIKYLDLRYTVLQVPLTVPGLTWLWVAKEAYRLISLSMDYDTRHRFSQLQIKKSVMGLIRKLPVLRAALSDLSTLNFHVATPMNFMAAPIVEAINISTPKLS